MKTIKETADIFNVHWQTVRNMIKRGELKSVKIGNGVRISEEEIERVRNGEPRK